MQLTDEHGFAAFACAADGDAMQDAGGGVLVCRTCGHRTDELGAGVLGDAFDLQHRQWGLRGDPHVWAALREEVSTVPTPTDPEEVRRTLVAAFARVSGIDLDREGDEPVRREAFAHGGMSSGLVDVRWWRTKGIPLLVQRATERCPAAEPAPGGGVLMGMVVWLVLLTIPAVLLGGGSWLLYQHAAGTRAEATVLACETTGNWRRYGSTLREECAARWTIDGETVVGNYAAGDGASEVGKSVDVTVRGDTAYSRSLALPLVLLLLGLPFLVPPAAAVRRALTRRASTS